jgi:hypothetical protein
VQRERAGRDPKLVEVDAGESRIGPGFLADVADDEAVDEVRLADHLHFGVGRARDGPLVQVLADQQHVAEEEGVNVHLEKRGKEVRNRKNYILPPYTAVYCFIPCTRVCRVRIF